MTKQFTLVACLFVSLCSPAFAQGSGQYRLVKRVTIGGDGGWDFLSLDAENRTLYITHGSQVETYNVDNDSLMQPILNTDGPHGVAIASRENHGFISCGKSNSVLEFDLKTRDTIQRISVGDKPDAIIYDPASRHIFVMNGKGNNITVLEATTGAQVSLIALPGNPESAVSDERGHVYVNIEDKSQIVKIDVGTDDVEAVWNIKPGKGPTALAMDRGTNRLFIGCANQKLIIMNAQSGKVLKTFPIGKGVDAGVFDPFSKDFFSANGGDGTTTIISETTGDKFRVAQTLKTELGARTITCDPHTHDIYLVTAQFGPPQPATKDKPKPHPSIIPGTFTLLKYALDLNGQGKIPYRKN